MFPVESARIVETPSAPLALARASMVIMNPMSSGNAIHLAYQTPYDLPRLMRFVAQRAIPGIEHAEGVGIRRSVRAGAIAQHAGWIEVVFEPEAARVNLRFSRDWTRQTDAVVAAVRRWLDLDLYPHAVADVLNGVPGEAGLRLPGSVDAFELAVRAVLGQQVTVAGARALAGRLVRRFGGALDAPWPDIHTSFPSPDVLGATTTESIAELGIIRTRANAVIALARAWPGLSARVANATATRQQPDSLIAALCALPGIGPWTAHYIAMRAVGWADAFLPNDVALLKAMKLRFGSTSQREADGLADAWRPWRAYAVLRLWNSLEAPGVNAR